MLKYYKVIENDYITAVGVNIEGEEIEKTEYEALLKIIRSKTNALDDCEYRLKTNLEWEKGVKDE